jgi:hypothetical protein
MLKFELCQKQPNTFCKKGLGIVLWKNDRMSATPGYFSLRFKFHVDSDSVSDSSWNSVSLLKSFNHSNCINRQIYCKERHSSTWLCASFCVVFIAIQQTMSAGKIAKDCYFRLLLYMQTWLVNSCCCISPHFLIDIGALSNLFKEDIF